MKKRIYCAITIILLIFLVTGCINSPGLSDNETPLDERTSEISLPTTTPIDQTPISTNPKEAFPDVPTIVPASETPNNRNDKLDIKTREDNFAKMIVDAINTNDITILSKYCYYINENSSSDDLNRLKKGFELYHQYFNNEEIIKYEYIGKPNWSLDNVICDKFLFVSESGIKRDIIIMCYTNSEVSFQYMDPLIFYGFDAVSLVEKYYRAIKTEDIEFMYNYLCMVYEDGDSKDYNEPDHNKNYETLAIDTINNYRNNYKLDSIDCKMTNVISDGSNIRLSIEFIISGISPQNDAMEHKIDGCFDYPMWFIDDTWFGSKSN